MKPPIPSFCLLAATLALACDPRGISVGTEELCLADPDLLLARAESTESLSSCARIGDNRLVGGGFEEPDLICDSTTFCQISATETLPWQTSSADNVIEVWHDGYNGVPAFEGSQFVELDARSPDTLWQDVELPPGQLMYWSFMHRGRRNVETVELSLGPPEAPVLRGSFSSPTGVWTLHSGLYRVGETEVETRFELASKSGLAEGNLIDAVVLAPVD